jgi:hypothetical protein
MASLPKIPSRRLEMANTIVIRRVKFPASNGMEYNLLFRYQGTAGQPQLPWDLQMLSMVLGETEMAWSNLAWSSNAPVKVNTWAAALEHIDRLTRGMSSTEEGDQFADAAAVAIREIQQEANPDEAEDSPDDQHLPGVPFH